MSVSSILSKIAPELEAGLALVGGPFGAVGAMAVKGVAAIVCPGKDSASAEDVQAALTGATPDQLLALQKLNDDFKTQTQKLNLDVLKIQAEQEEKDSADDTADRGSARDKFGLVKFIPQMVMTSLVTLAVCGITFGIVARMFQGLDATSASMLSTVVTAVIAVFMQQNNFWFGSTHGSQKKDETLAKAALS